MVTFTGVNCNHFYTLLLWTGGDKESKCENVKVKKQELKEQRQSAEECDGGWQRVGGLNGVR